VTDPHRLVVWVLELQFRLAEICSGDHHRSSRSWNASNSRGQLESLVAFGRRARR
jgi:hypothetical protein